jgi:uncharacterized protein with beta-barrel porin domain
MGGYGGTGGRGGDGGSGGSGAWPDPCDFLDPGCYYGYGYMYQGAGGNGGNGGNGGGGGNGGDGGPGVSGSAIVINNTGSITGGQGGSGGNNGFGGGGGMGGNGMPNGQSGYSADLYGGYMFYMMYSSRGGNGDAGISLNGGTNSIVNGFNGSITGGSSGGGTGYMYGYASSGDGVKLSSGTTAITNLGTILGGTGGSGSTYGIRLTENANISTLANLQGGNSPLTYYGALPGTYNIVVRSTTNFGRLAVAWSSGSMAFGVDSTSVLEANRYINVLTGVGAPNITNEDTEYSLGSYGWSLTASSTPNNWDLVVSFRGMGTGTTTDIASSNTTAFAGGTLLVSSSGQYSQNWSLGTEPSNRMNLGGNSSIFNGAFSDLVSGQAGNIIFSNAGSAVLTAISTYTGSTTVADGATLSVNGSIASSSGLTVNSGGTIGGTGSLPSTTVQAGGQIAPGNSIGTINVLGSLTLDGGAISSFEVNSSSADRIVATGNINLGGTLDLAFSGEGFDVTNPYTLIAGRAISGVFATIDATLPLGYRYAINYGTTNVQLLISRVLDSGMTTPISSPWGQTLAGGTVVVDSSGTYASNWSLYTSLGASVNSIDQNGNEAALSGVFGGSGDINFTNSGVGGKIALLGTSTYTGSTTVADGATLSVNGSIASSSGLTVNSGGTIGGTGSLPQTNLVSGAKLAPGNSIGMVRVAGLNLNGGTLDAEIQGPQNDKVSVTGNVTNFTGTAKLIPYGGGSPWPNIDYQLITASNNFATSSSLTLDQSGVTSALLNFGTNLVQEVDGNAATFDVQWQPKNGSGATASAVSSLGKGQRNQLATAGAFDNVFSSLATAAGNQSGTTTGLNATGTAIGTTGFTTGQAAAASITSDFLTATSQLLALTSGSQLTAAIDSLSPEPYSAYQAVGLSTLKRQRELLFSQAGNCQGNGWIINAPDTKKGKTPKRPVCVFAKANNATSSIRGQNGLSSYNSGIFSSFYGLEYKPSKQWSVGAAYGYGTSNLSDMRLTSANVSSDVNGGALYAVYKPAERWNIKALLGYSNFDMGGSRNVAYIGNGSTINGNTSANGYTAAINAAYDIPIKAGKTKLPMLLKPFAGLAWGGYQQSGFTESGGGALNLRVNGNTANSLVGTLGMEFTTSPIALSKNKVQSITPRLAVAYQVDALANTSSNKALTSSFVEAPAAGSFTTQGENGGANAFAVAGGFDLQVAKNASLYLTVSYELESNGSQFGYGGGLRVAF